MSEEIDDVLGRLGNEVISILGMSRNLGSDYKKLIAMLSKTPEGRKLAKQIIKSFGEAGELRDRVILEHRDKDGNLIERDKDGNLTAQQKDGNPIGIRDSGWQHRCLTNTGFASVAGLLLTDVGDTAYDYIGIGTGVVAADPTDTDLGTPVKRKVSTGTRQTTAVANDTAQLIATFAAADTLSGTDAITESGVMNAGAAGTMICRQVFAALNINWDAGDTLQITWKIQAKQGA